MKSSKRGKQRGKLRRLAPTTGTIKKTQSKMEVNSLPVLDVSNYGWAIFFSGGMVSFSSYKILAVTIGAIGIIVLIVAAAIYPKEQGALLSIKKANRFFVGLFIASLVCVFLKLMGVALLIMGSFLLLNGCFGLKHRAINLDASIFNPYGIRYSRKNDPFTYWVAIVVLLLGGAFGMLISLWAGLP